MGIILGAVFGISGALILKALFWLISGRWPEAYDSITRLIERAPRRGPISYIGFRSIPTFIVATLVATTSDRASANLASAYIALVVAHIVATDGKATLHARKRRDKRLATLSIIYVLNGINGLFRIQGVVGV